MTESLQLIDSHAHITSDSIYPHVDGVLERAKQAGIDFVINICTDQVTLERGLELHKRYPWVYNVAATTPHDVEKEGEELFPLMAEVARNQKIVAVGETGLDYYYSHSERSVQQDFLRRYLKLAVECGLPVVIHCREAFTDFFSILDEEYMDKGRHRPGVLHCFTGTTEEAEQVIDRGWYLSLSGIVTFKRSEELREVAKLVPVEQLLVETDSPYLAPQGWRGKQNEPAYMVETVKLIASVKNMDPQDLGRICAENTKKLFKI
ncbi:MAG: hydrolase TatD [Waddliaceae bacterium]|nr:hydrolase TatD [Waddliaceae bacterium]